MLKFFQYLLLCVLPLMGFSAVAETKVNLQLVWKHQMQFAGYYMAKEKGFYKAEGIDVTINEYASKVDALRSVVDGDIDFAIGRTSLVIDYLNGQPITFLGAIFQHSPLTLLAKKRADLKTVADLENKKIMITDNQMGLASIISMLRSAGLNQDDYTTVLLALTKTTIQPFHTPFD